MTRKQAIIALLAAPGGRRINLFGQEAAPRSPDLTGTATLKQDPVPTTTRIVVALGDRRLTKNPTEYGGIDGIELRYRGKTIEISAAEIWRALGGAE